MRPRPPSVRREGLESSGTRAGYIEQLYGFSDDLSEYERFSCRIVRWNRLWTSPFPSFRSGFSSAQWSRLMSGSRAESYDHIVDVHTPQFQDEILEVFQSTPQERVSERIVARTVDFSVASDSTTNFESRHRSVFRSGSSNRSSIWQCPRLASAGLAHRRAPPCRECFTEVHGVLSSTVVELVRHESRQRSTWPAQRAWTA